MKKAGRLAGRGPGPPTARSAAGKSTKDANTNSTGLAGWALGEPRRDRAGRAAAAWVRNLQVRRQPVRRQAGQATSGAIAYDEDAYGTGQGFGIKKKTSDQWRRASRAGAAGAAVGAAGDGAFTAPSAPRAVQAGQQLHDHAHRRGPGSAGLRERGRSRAVEFLSRAEGAHHAVTFVVASDRRRPQLPRLGRQRASRRHRPGHRLTVLRRAAPHGRRGHPPVGAAAVVGPLSLGPAAASACPGTAGVTVVVEFHELGGGSAQSCVADGGGHTADRLLKDAGYALDYVQRFPGFVCRIDGAPADDPCVNTPPADAYWGLWWSDGTTGKWTYSSLGAASLAVPAGGYVAMVWDGSTGTVVPAATAAVHPTPTPTPTHRAADRAPTPDPDADRRPPRRPRRRRRPRPARRRPRSPRRSRRGSPPRSRLPPTHPPRHRHGRADPTSRPTCLRAKPSTRLVGRRRSARLGAARARGGAARRRRRGGRRHGGVDDDHAGCPATCTPSPGGRGPSGSPSPPPPPPTRGCCCWSSPPAPSWWRPGAATSRGRGRSGCTPCWPR